MTAAAYWTQSLRWNVPSFGMAGGAAHFIRSTMKIGASSLLSPEVNSSSMDFGTKTYKHFCMRAKPAPSKNRDGVQQRSAEKLRLLRAHGLIQKVPKTYRYKVTEHGRQILTAIFTASRATVDRLLPKVA